MTLRLEALGVLLVAVLTFTIAAPCASGALYTASSYPTTLTGESVLGNDTLATEAGRVECKAHYEVTLAGASSTMTVKAKYVSCRALGFLEASLNMGSCDYLFGQPTGSGDTWSALVNIKCTSAASLITLTAGTCKFTIGEQGPLSNVALVNETAAGDITFKLNLAKIAYTVTEDGLGCPFGGIGAKEGATYVQHSPVTLDPTNLATVVIH